MQNMTEKGLLRRDTSKRTHIYEAAVTQEMIQEKFFDRFLDNVFGGSPLKLVMHTLGHDKTSSEDLEEIKKLISELEKK
jgi:predicted transcriptional regulator